MPGGAFISSSIRHRKSELCSRCRG